MPAYNAEKTLRKTYEEVMAQDYVDEVIVVDDKSQDNTLPIAKEFPNILVYSHARNMGYGANQKTCYRMALDQGGDIVIMVHPDYQYTPKLIPAFVSLIGNDVAGNICAGFNHHLQGPFDNALGLPVTRIPGDGDLIVFLDLPVILIKF